MADNEHVAEPSQPSDAPLVSTTTVEEESDSTAMEAIDANSLGKFLDDCSLLLASFLIAIRNRHTIFRLLPVFENDKHVFPPVLCKITLLQPLLPVPSF